MKTTFLKYIYTLLLYFGISSCTRFVAVPAPSNQLITSTVFTNDATANAAVLGIYSNMMTAYLGIFGGSVTLYSGLSADEFENYSFTGDQQQFAANSLKAENGELKIMWGQAYQYIYAANAILEGLSKSTSVSAATSQELQGEAKFIRGFCYFYLLNLWGDPPLVIQTGYHVNDSLHRTSSVAVYQQIIRDLKDAQALLLPDYSKGGGERIRPNQSAATALLARVYLYTGNWNDALIQSSAVIQNTGLYGLDTDLNTVFLANSPEAIWQLQPVTPSYNTWEGYFFILTGGPNSSPAEITLRSELLSGFEPGDARKDKWTAVDSTTGPYYIYPLKYKVQAASVLTEYEMVLRLAEQYLIRAEAQAHLNNLSPAISDLNIIRERAGLADLPLNLTLQETLNAVAQERRVELFAEWGHRWMDLKRTQQASAVLQPVKSGWQATDTLYPLPVSEIQNDPGLSQNPGY